MLGGDYLKVAVLPVRRPSSIRAQLIMAARPARRCRPGTVAAHRPSAGQNQVGPITATRCRTSRCPITIACRARSSPRSQKATGGRLRFGATTQASQEPTTHT
jgi:hypothetical protein